MAVTGVLSQEHHNSTDISYPTSGENMVSMGLQKSILQEVTSKSLKKIHMFLLNFWDVFCSKNVLKNMYFWKSHYSFVNSI